MAIPRTRVLLPLSVLRWSSESHRRRRSSMTGRSSVACRFPASIDVGGHNLQPPPWPGTAVRYLPERCDRTPSRNHPSASHPTMASASTARTVPFTFRVRFCFNSHSKAQSKGAATSSPVPAFLASPHCDGTMRECTCRARVRACSGREPHAERDELPASPFLIFARRKGKEKIVCLTAYTAPMAALLDPHCDLLLVGDSVGMVVHGMPNTVGVTLEMMILHGQAVMRGSSAPWSSSTCRSALTKTSPEQALRQRRAHHERDRRARP